MNRLHQAADYLRNGWCQGTYKRDHGNGNVEFCGVGAIAQTFAFKKNGVIDLNGVDTAPEIDVLAKVIVDNYPEHYELSRCHGQDVITFFNDEVAQSSDEVVAMFEKAAIQYDEVLDNARTIVVD